MAINAKGHIAVDGAMPNVVGKKPAQKKTTTKQKPKSDEVIDIRSDAEEVKKEKPFVNTTQDLWHSIVKDSGLHYQELGVHVYLTKVLQAELHHEEFAKRKYNSKLFKNSGVEFIDPLT
ncbi:hypothetical protein Fot_05743 [Forsythia ovata]|uniref:Uncharacterized protein n=1 Tax=Forsythia ovata TaxID=205694 RepID=A0ABD1WR41_9LAMI